MIHHVFANRSNIGDWLSARGIQQLLAPYPVVEHLCDEPFVAATLAALSTTSVEDLIVIGGGGLFMDYFVPFWQGFQSIASRTPSCIWGVGYCDLKLEPSRPPQALIEQIATRCRLCVVRDELTHSALARCALPPPVPCPSLVAVDEPAQQGFGLLHVDNYTTAGADVYEAMDAHSRAFAGRTQRPYWTTNNRIPAGSEAARAAVLARYAAADIVLSSALHGCIFAVAMGRKVLAVSGDRKIEGFMQAAGLGQWVCDLDEVDQVPERLASLAGQPTVHPFVQQARAANRAVAAHVLAVGNLAGQARTSP
jgi:polysaccharide pyruvyl transferase WcaK-like protein